MRAERRLRRLEESYQRRAVSTLSREEILFLLRVRRRGLRDGVETIAPEHQARALPLMTLLVGEWS
jgi:hypothetical protein